MTDTAKYTKAIRAIRKADHELEKTLKEFHENKNLQTKSSRRSRSRLINEMGWNLNFIEN